MNHKVVLSTEDTVIRTMFTTQDKDGTSDGYQMRHTVTRLDLK